MFLVYLIARYLDGGIVEHKIYSVSRDKTEEAKKIVERMFGRLDNMNNYIPLRRDIAGLFFLTADGEKRPHTLISLTAIRKKQKNLEKKLRMEGILL